MSVKDENDTDQSPVVIVTGASSGIGCETARAFLDRGCRVVLAARHRARLEQVAAENPHQADRCLVMPTDVTSVAAVTRLVRATVQRWGRIDILVNNAGIGLRATVANTKADDAERVMETNLYGPLHCLQAVLSVMRAQPPDDRGIRGTIVNVGSVLSMVATPRNAIYCASKFALRALSDALRLELKTEGIDVILVMPGYTDTAFFDRMIRYEGPARVTSLAGQHPRKVARAIVRACQSRQREVLLTIPAMVGVRLKKWMPRLLDWALSQRA